MRASFLLHVRPSLAVALGVAACGGASQDASTLGEGPRSHASRPSEEDAREARLAPLEPTAVAPGERGAYFDAVTSVSPPYSTVDPEPTRPDPESMRKVLGLDQLVGTSDPPLSGHIHEWLVHAAQDFAQAYYQDAAKVLAMPPSSPWHRAEAAWVTWLSAHESTLTEQEAYAVGNAIFSRGPTTGVPTFPGLDRFAFCLTIADQWIRDGHPGLRDHVHPAAEDVVCAVEPSSGKLYSSCEDRPGWWYPTALESDADLQRLVQVVLARKDPSLTRAVAAGIGLSPKTLDVLHAWEADPVVWRDALFVIAREDDGHWMRDWLFPDMRRVWAAHPPWRGAILYGLALASGPFADNGPTFEVNVAFDCFARDFAGGVTRADFASFLDQTPRAIEFAPWLMPDRTKGWSVADVILPKLDAYLALPQDVPPDAPQGPGWSMVVSRMCSMDHDLPGLAKLKAYFDKRAPGHPGDRLNALMDSYGPKDCGQDR